MTSVLVKPDGSPRPSLAPSAIAVGLLPRAREAFGTYGLLPLLGGLLVGWYALPYAAVPVWLLAVAVGTFRTFGLLHRGQPRRGWQTGHRVLALTVTATVLLPLVAVGFPRVSVLLGLGVLELLLHRPRSLEAAPESRLSHARLVGALITAEVVKPDPAPMLSYQGPPRVDDRGITATVKVTPPTVTWQQVRAKHERIAAALDLPPRALEISGDPSKAPNVVTFWISTGAPAPRTLTLTERCDWSQPILLGEDARGRSSWFLTRGRHSLLVAATGAGKTALCRSVLSRALLDPAVTRLWVVDGKGMTDDLAAAGSVPGVVYVAGSGAEAVRQFVAVLEEVEAERERRRHVPSDQLEDAVLVVDELYKLRRAADRVDKTLVEKIDGLMGEIAATARSARIHLILCAQRGVVDYVPGDLQANLTQRLLGVVADKAEASYVLDLRPAALPSQPGEFLVSEDGREPVLITTPHLTDAAWRDVCTLAAALRSDRAPEPEATPATPAVVAEPTDALVDAVVELLAAAGGPLTATELYELLPEQVRPASPLAVGKRLADVPEVVRKHRGNRPAWTIGTLGAAPSAAARATLGAPSAAPSAGGQDAALHAQTPSSGPAPSAPSAQP